jgi:hypothetical protein
MKGMVDAISRFHSLTSVPGVSTWHGSGAVSQPTDRGNDLHDDSQLHRRQRGGRSIEYGDLHVGILATANQILLFHWSHQRICELNPLPRVFLSLLPPLVGGIDVLDKTGVVAVLVVVVGLHVVTMNLVYPKFIGHRLKLNPLAVSLSLLFWAWIWGAPGLILAIPLLGAAKIICDHVEPLCGLGSWLGDSNQYSSA